MNSTQQDIKDMQEAGTGFMKNQTEAMHQLEAKGYTENLTPKYDHFESRSGEIKIYPDDFIVDSIARFENTSDPDDQTILYAISIPARNLKGLYLESYGLYHEDFSKSMSEKMKEHFSKT